MRVIPAFLLLVSACDGGSGTAPALPLAPAGGATAIAAIQGTGSSSPLEGRVVTLTGIVTGDFQENDADDMSNLGGFFVQAERPDNDASTSDGVFVHDGANPSINVDVGDRVRVTGTVQEYFGETQISDVDVSITGSGNVVPIEISLPLAAITENDDDDLIADFEPYEGMLVRFPQTLSVTDLRNLERFGSVGLSQGGRLYQFTNDHPPDTVAYGAHKESTARRRIRLDDGRRADNASPVRYLGAGASPGYSIRTGDTVTGLTGNLRYSRGSGGDGTQTWRLVPTIEPIFDAVNPRPMEPSVEGEVRIASFNVLNFFSTIDSGEAVCGPRNDDGCRGADSPEELARQLGKTVSALALLDADIVGLMEIENNQSDSLRMIVDALNDRVGANEYAYVDTGTIHDDVIKTGFLYRASKIALRGDFALLDRSVDARFNDARNRPALAQTFEVTGGGGALTVVVNHLKSKGSSCDVDGDPNTSDGQGNCNKTRTSAAAAIADWIATDPTGSNDPDFLVIGDLNAYTREEPLTVFRDAGLTNLLESVADPYSFVFDG